MSTQRTFDKLVVHERSDRASAVCRFCDRPIRHYDEVGWIDTTPAVEDGTYDMCPANDKSGEHLPKR